MHHVFYEKEVNSSLYDMIKNNLLNFLDIKALIRVKANLYPNQNIKKINEMHKDYLYKHKGAIFSINGTKIDSVENRMLFFDPSIEHDSENCTNDKVRINININYF